jgi:hypothetical protein
MSDWFEIGKQCVCLRDDWYQLENMVFPVKDGVYTVRTIEPSTVFHKSQALRFEEIRNPPGQFAEGFIEISFSVKDADGNLVFRPCKKTNISAIKGLLKPTDEDAKLYEKEYVEAAIEEILDDVFER